MLGESNVAFIRDPAPRLREDLSLEYPPASVLKILNGALKVIGERGADRLSMSDICRVSGVSRGTLYRYFATKEDVLAAVSEFVSLSFENGIREVAVGVADPLERVRVVLDFHDHYSSTQEADSTLLVEPLFVVTFFRSHFQRHCAAMLDALETAFDHFDASRSKPIDRLGLVEMLVRLQVSRLILPGDEHWPKRWAAAKAVVLRVLAEPAD